MPNDFCIWLLSGGLETETDYPYDGEDDKCTFKKSEAKVDITGALNISSSETGKFIIMLYTRDCYLLSDM